MNQNRKYLDLDAEADSALRTMSEVGINRLISAALSRNCGAADIVDGAIE
jgi:hypothetical protein